MAKSAKKVSAFSRVSSADRAFDIINLVIMLFVTLICVYPFYYCVIISFNEGYDALKGGIYLIPRMFTLENYEIIFQDGTIINAFVVTLVRTVIGTALSLVLTAFMAFSMIRKQLVFRRLYITLGIVTMYFSGGLIPLYLLIKNMGMVDSFWVYIIPNLFSFYNTIIMMAFFREIPVSMIEASKLDGANEWQVFWKVVMPVSTAVIATICMYNAVSHWNAWFDGYIYISDPKKKTLALLLVEMINEGKAMEALRTSGNSLVLSGMSGPTENSVRLATMVVAVVPIMCVYPFCQKYFIQGIMLGAVKG